jgi:hypothetical protein
MFVFLHDYFRIARSSGLMIRRSKLKSIPAWRSNAGLAGAAKNPRLDSLSAASSQESYGRHGRIYRMVLL